MVKNLPETLTALSAIVTDPEFRAKVGNQVADDYKQRISGIAGNTAVRSTDAETGLKPIFDAQKVQREIDAQVAITQSFGKEASTAIGTYAKTQLAQAEAKQTEGLIKQQQANKATSNKTDAQSLNIGSAVSGATVNVIAGADINVKGSSVISDTATTLVAGNNVNIEAATNTSRQTSLYKKEESGLLSGGGLGVTLGSREQSTDQKGVNTTAVASNHPHVWAGV